MRLIIKNSKTAAPASGYEDHRKLNQLARMLLVLRRKYKNVPGVLEISIHKPLHFLATEEEVEIVAFARSFNWTIKQLKFMVSLIQVY